MTARQLLHEYVESLSEDDAEVTAALLVIADRPLTARERRAILQGLAEADTGKLTSLEEIEREYDAP